MSKELQKLRNERLTQLRERAVEPFVRELDKLLEAAPSATDIAEFAVAKPNDWANMVKSFATLAGYADKTEIKFAGIVGHIQDLSDAQLLDVMRQVLEQKKEVDFQPDLSSNGK